MDIVPIKLKRFATNGDMLFFSTHSSNQSTIYWSHAHLIIATILMSADMICKIHRTNSKSIIEAQTLFHLLILHLLQLLKLKILFFHQKISFNYVSCFPKFGESKACPHYFTNTEFFGWQAPPKKRCLPQNKFYFSGLIHVTGSRLIPTCLSFVELP